MKTNNIHVVIACGGTGGHFFPTLAIARKFQHQGGQVTLFVAGHHCQEQLAIAAKDGLPAEAMYATRLPGKSATALLFPFRFLYAILLSRHRLKLIRPDLVLGMGSFAAAATCLAAVSLKIPLVLHEGNSWPGRTNRWLSRWARALATSLPLLPDLQCRCPQSRTGMPLRENLEAAAQKQTLPEHYHAQRGLAPDKPTLLVFGGSQGARFLNDLIPQATAFLTDKPMPFQVIHLTGTDNNDDLIDAYSQAGLTAWVHKADSQIEHCYLAADLVLCRAGASTLSELALFGKPAILIPLPSAAEDHQTANAKMMANLDAACLLPQSEATPQTVANLLCDWIKNPQEWQATGRKIKQIACPAAAEAVAGLLWTASNEQ